MNRIYITFLLFIVNVCSFGQLVQKGSVLEYNGSEPKTVIYEPITITAVGAPSTYSDTGKFFLNFLDKKKGDRLFFINNKLPQYIGYELFNAETIKNWNLSETQSLNIIFCKKSKFREYVENYYLSGNKSYEQQLNAEKQKLYAAFKKNEILRKEYDKKLNELEDFYDEQLKNLRNYAERFARIDLSELSPQESQAIEMFNKGDVQGAIKTYEDLHLKDKLDVVLNNINERNEGIRLLEEENTKDYSNKNKIISSIINQIKAYYMVGGGNNLEKIKNLLTDIHIKDTLNIDICFELGNYYKNTGKLIEAEVYFRKAANLCDYEHNYAREIEIYDYMASFYLEDYDWNFRKYYDHISKAFQILSENANEFDISIINDFKTKFLFASYYVGDYENVKRNSEEIINYYSDTTLQTKDDAAQLIIAETYLGFVDYIEGHSWESILHYENALYLNDLYNVTYNDNEEQRYENGNIIYDYSYENIMSKINLVLWATIFSDNTTLSCLFYTIEMSVRGYGSYHDFDRLNNYSQNVMLESIRILNKLIEIRPNWVFLKEAKGILQIHANRIRDAYNTMLEIKDYSNKYGYSNRHLGSYVMYFFYYSGNYYVNKGEIVNFEDFGYIAPDDEQFMFRYNYTLKVIIDRKKFGYTNENGLECRCIYDFAEPYIYLPESGRERSFNAIAKVYKKDKVGLIDERGTMLIPFKYDEIIDFYKIYGKDTLICFARKGDKWQILSNKPKLSSKLCYDCFVKCGGTCEDDYFYGDYVCARKNDKLLVINIKDPLKSIDCEFDSIGTFWHDLGYLEHILVKKNNKYNIYNVNNHRFIFSEYCDAINSCIDFENRGTSYDGRYIGFSYYDDIVPGTIPYKKNGYWGFASEENENYIPCIFDSVTEFFGHWESANGLFVSIVKKKGKTGLITNKGEYKLECKYDEIENNFHFLTVQLDKKYGVYTINGTEIVPIEYEQIRFGDNYFLCLKDNLWYLYSNKGQLFDFEINDIYITDGIVSEVNIGTVWYTIDELLVNGK